MSTKRLEKKVKKGERKKGGKRCRGAKTSESKPAPALLILRGIDDLGKEEG